MGFGLGTNNITTKVFDGLFSNIAISIRTPIYGGAALINGNCFFGVGGFAPTASDNTGFGVGVFNLMSGPTATGGSNCAFGQLSMAKNLTGANNCAFGQLSLFNADGVLENSAFGYECLYSLNTSAAVYNSAFGGRAGWHLTTGNRNSAFGDGALFNCVDGNGNAAFGEDALSSATGSNNLGLGTNAQVPSSSGSNQLALGNFIFVDSSGNMTLGSGVTIGNYVNDAAAAAGGVPVGGIYRNSSALMIRVS